MHTRLRRYHATFFLNVSHCYVTFASPKKKVKIGNITFVPDQTNKDISKIEIKFHSQSLNYSSACNPTPQQFARYT